MHGHGTAVANQAVDDRAARRGQIEHRDGGAGGGEGADVLTAQAAEPAGDDGDAAVEAKAIREDVGVGQVEGLPPRDLHENPGNAAENVPVRGQSFMN